MKKTFIIFIFTLSFPFFGIAQVYEQYMQDGRNLFDKGDFVTALENFDQAYEIANSDSTEQEAESWKGKSMEKIKQSLADYNSLKQNTESILRIALNEPKPRGNYNKKLYEVSKNKGISYFNKSVFYDAHQYFKLAKLCPDYVPDTELDSYLGKATDSINNTKKLALVIGNANYVEGNLEKVLTDAKDVTKSLESIGFKVITGFNLKTQEMNDLFNQFFTECKGYDMVLFYYSGFGYQSDYLLPVDTKTDAEGNLKSWISINYLMTQFKTYAKAKRIFILDMDRTVKSGFVPSVMTYNDFLVFFSTSPNRQAYNGVGRNSLFTEQLLKFLTMQNTSFQEVFRLTREAVSRVSKYKQVPTIYDNIQNNIYLNCKIE